MKNRNAVSPWTSEARRLRTEMTPDMGRLWSRLRRRQLDGFRFRREHPIGPYFVDFFCHSAKLAIEVDGEIHRHPQNVKYDRRRDKYIEGIGITLLRFTNEDVRFCLESVLNQIRTRLNR